MSMRQKRWGHEPTCLKHARDGIELVHPTKVPSSAWIDDTKRWPPMDYKNIFNYLVLSEGVDGESMENYKSMDSYVYFESGKVGAVLVYEAASGFFYLKAKVTPSQSVNNAKHTAWVLTTSDGVVETDGCECLAGRGRSCSHAGAILWKLEYAFTTGRSGTSCTDTEQRWNRGTSNNLMPRRIEDINFKRKCPAPLATADNTAVVETSQLPELPAFLTQEDFTKHADSLPVSKLFKITGTMISKAYHVQPVNMKSAEAAPAHSSHADNSLSCLPCKHFYDKFIHVNKSKCSLLNETTRGQSESSVWRDARRLRLTGSTAHKVPSCPTTNPVNFLREQMYPSFRGNHATEHGKRSKPKALQALLEMGYTVCCQGTVVSTTEPWLSGSPDGIINGDTILEVKCPLLQGQEQFNKKLRTDGLCDVAVIGGRTVLQKKGRRGYYMQVQLTMFCTDLRKSVGFFRVVGQRTCAGGGCI